MSKPHLNANLNPESATYAHARPAPFTLTIAKESGKPGDAISYPVETGPSLDTFVKAYTAFRGFANTDARKKLASQLQPVKERLECLQKNYAEIVAFERSKNMLAAPLTIKEAQQAAEIEAVEAGLVSDEHVNLGTI